FYCESGMSWLRAMGSITAPERIWAPISEPFSTTQTLMSCPFSAASWRSRIAADSPAGPPPTMTTSNSIDSRSIRISLFLSVVLLPLADPKHSRSRAWDVYARSDAMGQRRATADAQGTRRGGSWGILAFCPMFRHPWDAERCAQDRPFREQRRGAPHAGQARCGLRRYPSAIIFVIAGIHELDAE